MVTLVMVTSSLITVEGVARSGASALQVLLSPGIVGKEGCLIKSRKGVLHSGR